jgi:hypothetical protein
MISISPSRPRQAAAASGRQLASGRAEGKGFEPSSLITENRLSRAARPTVSGYLPVLILKWTTGESNPDLLVAGQASFRWTSSPLNNLFQVTEVGVEPTKSRGSRPRRFSSLRTQSVAGPGVAPGGGAYETPLGTGPPAAVFLHRSK